MRRARPDAQWPASLRSAGGSPARPGATSSGRCGRNGPWSRRSGRAAPSTCWRPRTCRCGPARCRRCRCRCRSHPEPVRFSADEADEVIAAIGDALQEAELTVDELTDAIRERTGPWAVERTMDAFQDKWPRWRQLTSTAAHRGVLCFGPNKGRNVTYTNPHRWLPGFRPSTATDALRDRSSTATSTRSGRPRPSTSPGGSASRRAPRGRRSRRWATSSSGRRRRRACLGGGGRHRRSRRGPPKGSACSPTSTPTWSPASLGLACSRAPAATRALTPSGQAGNYPVLLVDGVVGGVWHQRRSGRRVEITVEPLGDSRPAQRRELEAEAALVAAVLEGEPELTIGTVTVGAHA